MLDTKFDGDDSEILVTVLPFFKPISTIFEHKRQALTSQRCHQYRNFVTITRKLENGRYLPKI